MRKLFETFRCGLQRHVNLKLHLLVVASFVTSCTAPELSSSPRVEPIFEFSKSCGENSFRKDRIRQDDGVILWSSVDGEKSFILESTFDNCFISFKNHHQDQRFLPTIYKTEDILDSVAPIFEIDGKVLSAFGTYDFMAQFSNSYLLECVASGSDRQLCIENLSVVAENAINLSFVAQAETGTLPVVVQILDATVYFRGQQLL